MEYKTLTFEQIVNWCKENGKVDWLKAEVAKKGANGKAVSFIEVKRDFAAEFMPEIMPKKAAKRKTMLEIVAEL